MVLAVGESFEGRYRVISHLAKGGMGAVYEAVDERLERRVALKVLLPQLSENRDALLRFEREAVAVARLRHHAIPRVHDAGTSSKGEPYLIMELVEGSTLAKMLTEGGAMAPELAADLARQLASALSSAHEAGIVHRDLKPANVMVVQEHGRAALKLLDFGIARLKSSDAYTRLTQLGAVMGTPSFMAPEQARGAEADVRTDVHGVGVLLFCQLTGRRPFVGTDMASIVMSVLTEVPPRVDTLVRGVSPALASICAQALEKDPDRRFGSMRELEAPLAHAQAPLTHPGHPLNRTGQTSMATQPMAVHDASLLASQIAGVPLSREEDRSSARHQLEQTTLPPRPSGPGMSVPPPRYSAPHLSMTPSAAGLPSAAAIPSAAAARPASSPPWLWLVAAAMGGALLVVLLLAATGIAYYASLRFAPPAAIPAAGELGAPAAAAPTAAPSAAPSTGAVSDVGEMPAGLSPHCTRSWACCAEYSRVMGRAMDCRSVIRPASDPSGMSEALCSEASAGFANTVRVMGGNTSACEGL